MALLAVGVGFVVKRWREDRKQRADEEYERRRWGQETALEVLYFTNASSYNLPCQLLSGHRADPIRNENLQFPAEL